MSDLISRQAAIDALKKHEIELSLYAPRETDEFWNDAIDCCVSEIENLPSQEPERMKGEWIQYEYSDFCKCSVCKNISSARWNYCPNCGADMRGDNNE